MASTFSRLLCYSSVFLLFFFCFLEGRDAVTTLRIGGTLSLTGGTTRVPLGLKVRDGITLFEQWFANQSDIVVNGEAYRIEIDVFDDESSLNVMQSKYAEMLASGNYDYYLGPINADFGVVAKDIIDGKGLLMHTTASDDDVSIGTKSTYTIKAPGSVTFEGALTQARLAGARTFSYIAENQLYQIGACDGAQSLASELGFAPAVCNYSVPNSLLIANGTEQVYADTLEHLARHCVQDVVILCAYDDSTVLLMLERARQLNWSPKLFMITRMRLGKGDLDPLEDYVVGSIIWSPGLDYPDDGLFGTPQAYGDLFRASFGYTADSFCAVGTAAPLYLWNAVRSAASTGWQDVSYALGRSDFQTFWGRVYYGANHAVLVQPVTLQWQPNSATEAGKAAAIAPPSQQTSELIYPMPAWDERAQTTAWMAYYGDVVMTVLAALASLLSIAGVAFVVVFRQSRVLRASQPTFLVIALAGSVLMYSSVYTWLYHVDDASCLALPWLLATGFSLVFACLASKTWRVYRLFSNSKLRAVSLSLCPLFAFLLVSCAVVWTLLAIWSAVDPLTARLVVPDANRPALNYYSCQTGMVGNSLLITILSIEGVLLIATAIIAFRVRNVQLLLFNESKFIGLAVYTLAIVGAICIGFAGSQLSPTAWFWLRTSCILAAAFTTVLYMMVPKLVYHLRLTAAPAIQRTLSNANSVDSAIARSEDDETDHYRLLLYEVRQLEEENARLRASLNS